MEKRINNFLSLKSMEDLLGSSGCTRISDEAKFFLRDILEQEGKDIGVRAWQFAQHAGRKTIKKVDIIAAIKENKRKKDD